MHRRGFFALLLGGWVARLAPLLARRPLPITRTIKPSGGDYAGPAAALAAITDAGPDRPYRLLISPGIYRDVEWRTKDFVDLVGLDRATCRFDGALPPDAAAATIERTSTLWLDHSATLASLTITATNMRYAIHMETGGHVPDAVHRIIDCTVEHYGNATAVNNKWPSQFAVGAGLSSGVQAILRRSSFKAKRRAFSYHSNRDFAKPTLVDIADCRFEATDPDGVALQLLPIGSGARDRCRLVRSQLIGSIYYAPEPWLPTTLAEQPANHAEIELSGFGNTPAPFINKDFGLALEIASARMGSGGSVRIAGDAVPLLFGDGQAARYETVAGSPGFPAAVRGWGDISGVGVGMAGTVVITSLGLRLGDCSRRPRRLLMSVDGGAPVEILFARDFRGADNGAVMDLIAHALGGRATVGTHAPGARYRPAFADEEYAPRNASATGIAMGSVVARAGAGGVRLMTAADRPGDFAGVAWQDIPAGATGRVKHRGLLPPGDILRTDSGRMAVGSGFSIDPQAPGRLRAGGSQGLLRMIRPGALQVG